MIVSAPHTVLVLHKTPLSQLQAPGQSSTPIFNAVQRQAEVCHSAGEKLDKLASLEGSRQHRPGGYPIQFCCLPQAASCPVRVLQDFSTSH